MLKYVLKSAAMNLALKSQNPKLKNPHKEQRQIAKNYKNRMIEMFGKTRWILSLWFGTGAFHWFNHNDYSAFDEQPYQHFYSSLEVAKKYEKRLQQTYQRTSVKPIYDDHKSRLGYMLTGEGKFDTTNVIRLADYKCRAN